MNTLSIKTDSSFQVKDSDGNSLGGMSNINTTGTTAITAQITLPISCKTFYGNASKYSDGAGANTFIDAVWTFMNGGSPDNYWNHATNAQAMCYVIEYNGTQYVSRPVAMRLTKVASGSGYYTTMKFYYTDNQEVNVTPTLEQKRFAWVFDDGGQQSPVSSISSLYAYPLPMVTNVTIQGSVSGGEVQFLGNNGAWGTAFQNTAQHQSTLVVTVLKCTNTN